MPGRGFDHPCPNGRISVRKSEANLHRDQIRTPVYIRCREAQETKPGADEAILAAVVIDEPITMVATVVLDRQPLKPIEKVGTAQESAVMVFDGNLSVRPRDAGQNQKHAQARLHR